MSLGCSLSVVIVERSVCRPARPSNILTTSLIYFRFFVSPWLRSCHLCLQKCHLFHTLSLSKAFDLSFTPTGKLSVRRNKGVKWNVASMVCAKTTDAHIKQVAAAAFRSATVDADEAQAQVPRLRDTLRSDNAEQPDVARGAIMARATTALSGPNSRAEMVRYPLGAFYHSSLATGWAAGMPRDVALLFAGASQAGVDIESLSSGEAPNSTVLSRAARKRLAETAAEKRFARVPKIDGRLGNMGGVSTSNRARDVFKFC